MLSPDDYSFVYQEMRQALLGFFQKRINDPELAEDLVHEVFLKAIVAGKKGAVPNNLTGWIYKIARNLLIDHYRTRRPTERVSEDLIQEAPIDENAIPGLSICIKRFVQELPEIYRKALISVEFEEENFQQLANKEKISLSAIKSRVSRGRKILKTKLLICCEFELSRKGSVLNFENKSSTCSNLCN